MDRTERVWRIAYHLNGKIEGCMKFCRSVGGKGLFHPRIYVCVCTRVRVGECVCSATESPISVPVFACSVPALSTLCCLTAPRLPVCSLSRSWGLHGSPTGKQAPALMVKPDAQAPSRLGPLPGQNEQWSCEGGPAWAASDRGGPRVPRGTGPDKAKPNP